MPTDLLEPPIAPASLPLALIGLRSAGMLMTPEEYEAIPRDEWDQEYRYELVHGVLVVTPFAGPGETFPNDELSYLIRSYMRTDVGRNVDTTYEWYLRVGDSYRRVDRVIWIGLGRHPAKEDVPAIAIEFVADSSRDRRRDYVDKRDDYAVVGVKEYWVIDRFRRQMTVFRGTSEPLAVGEKDVYTTDLMPGFELPLARLLFLADRDRPT